MDDLISRAELLKAYDAEHIGQPGRARKLIEDAPAIRIVLCKDCKNRFNGCCYSRKSNRINFTVDVADNWFCADGERKQS